MGDRVSPSIKIVEMILPSLISPIVIVNLAPKIEAQAIKIRADRTRMRIASVELAIQRKLHPKDRTQNDRVNDSYDMVGGFGV